MKRNLVILGAVIVAIVVIVAFNWPDKEKGADEAAASNQTGAATGEPLTVGAKPGNLAPSFELSSIEGDTEYKAGGSRDKPLIVNFWASWCGPCDQEAPDLVALYEKYKARVDLYGVNETKYDTVRGAKDFVKEKGLTFPVMLDKSGSAGDDYKVYSYPISFIVDKDGVIRYRIEGGQSVADWEKMLKDVL